jgi:hypothetical protein
MTEVEMWGKTYQMPTVDQRKVIRWVYPLVVCVLHFESAVRGSGDLDGREIGSDNLFRGDVVRHHFNMHAHHSFTLMRVSA